MNSGSPTHQIAMIEQLWTDFRRAGCLPCREFPVHGEYRGYIDLLVQTSTGRLAIEVELSAGRIAAALLKASAAGADELWIITPTHKTANVIRLRLEELKRQLPNTPYLILTLPQARRHIARRWPTTKER